MVRLIKLHVLPGDQQSDRVLILERQKVSYTNQVVKVAKSAHPEALLAFDLVSIDLNQLLTPWLSRFAAAVNLKIIKYFL